MYPCKHLFDYVDIESLLSAFHRAIYGIITQEVSEETDQVKVEELNKFCLDNSLAVEYAIHQASLAVMAKAGLSAFIDGNSYLVGHMGENKSIAIECNKTFESDLNFSEELSVKVTGKLYFVIQPLPENSADTAVH